MQKPVKGKDSHFMDLSSWDKLVPGRCKTWVSLLLPESGMGWLLFRRHERIGGLGVGEVAASFLEEADFTFNKEELVLGGRQAEQ